MPRYRWADEQRDRIIVTNEDTGDDYTVNVGTEEYNSINIEQVEPPDDDDGEDDDSA